METNKDDSDEVKDHHQQPGNMDRIQSTRCRRLESNRQREEITNRIK